jgi:Uncharacterized protein conserved in bacteria (DUF2252)
LIEQEPESMAMTAVNTVQSGVSTHDPVEERGALGRSVRERVPRSTLASWEAGPDRTDPVDVLEAQAITREPGLVPLRYGRMMTSPFAFYRGGARLMAADLATLPHTGLTVQLCGDAHLANFGAYAAPDRRLVFSLNDFDETLPGPFEWDVARLAASFEIAARHRGFGSSRRRKFVATAVRSYRRAIHDFAVMTNLGLWYQRLDVDEIPDRFGDGATAAGRKRFAQAIRKAKSKNSLRAIAKLTEIVDGQPRFRSDPPTLVPIEELIPPAEVATIPDRIAEILSSYRTTLAPDRQRIFDRYRYVHVARKVVGVGSVGTRTWVLLLMGRDEADPLLLQFKEAQTSALEPFLGRSDWATSGQRIVEGQRLMQGASDIFLGWHRGAGIDGVERDFFVRQLWDAKGSADLETIDAGSLEIYAALCGWTLALAHARSGDSAAIAGYLGGGDRFDRSMVEFAGRYADQNERDHHALCRAIEDGRVAAIDG